MFCLSRTWTFGSELATPNKGKQISGPAEGQAVPMRPTVVAQAPIVNNEINNPAVFISNQVLSAIADCGFYITGLVNHSETCILLDTGATVSVLNEETWKKKWACLKSQPSDWDSDHGKWK